MVFDDQRLGPGPGRAERRPDARRAASHDEDVGRIENRKTGFRPGRRALAEGRCSGSGRGHRPEARHPRSEKSPAGDASLVGHSCPSFVFAL